MKYLFFILLPLIALTGCTESASTQSTDTKPVGVNDKITVDNADLVTEFDESDIESMVTYYFASRIRKDDKWKEVLPESVLWSNRMKRSIEEHNKWNFVEFQNIGLQGSEYGWSVKVYMMLEFNEEKDDGYDEVEVEQVSDKWIITKVPT